MEDFEGVPLSLPFDINTSSQSWTVDATHSYSGTRSITNSLVDATNTASDVTLKIHVTDPSTVSCMAKIDTSMPYDFFALYINGDQRNSYYSKMSDEWLPVFTVISPGENIIVFRVQYSNMDLPDDYPERVSSLHGVGQVWLDDCKIVSRFVDSDEDPTTTTTTVATTTAVPTTTSSDQDLLAVGTTNSNGYTILDKITTEDFEGSTFVVPFDTSSTSQSWTLDTTQSYSGTQSITNSPVDEINNPMSDLSIKVYVQDPSTVSCMAKIDIAMPYDYFALYIDGQQRNSYHSKMEEWIPVVTSIGVGEHTLIFRVQHSNLDLPEDYPEREPSLQGVGQVWLDDCKIVSQLVDSEEPTTTTTTVATATPRPELWYPVEDPTTKVRSCAFDALYPVTYTLDTFLFESEEDCCANYPEACPPPSGVVDGQSYWYPIQDSTTGIRSCVYDANYPPEYGIGLLLDTEEECCALYGCPPQELLTTTSTTPFVKVDKWYPVEVDGIPTCSFGSDYPDSFVLPPELEGVVLPMLFDDEEECCVAYEVPYPQQEDVSLAPPAVEELTTNTTVVATSTTVVTTTSSTPKPDLWYPYQDPVTSVKSCAFDTLYPETYTLDTFLFESEEDCCANYPEACPQEIVKIDKWYPIQDSTTGIRSCVYDANYPDEYGPSLLLDSKEECCASYPDACVTTTSTTVFVKTDKWYPVQVDGKRMCAYNSEYPDTAIIPPGLEGIVMPMLFDDEEECCTSYEVPYPQEMDDVDATKPPFWYPFEDPDTKVRSCMYDALYDVSYIVGIHLFESEEGCCVGFPEACPQEIVYTDKWYPIEDPTTGIRSCVYDANYPTEYYGSALLLDSEEECCASFPGVCIQGIEDGQSYWYPSLIDNSPSCVYDADYPQEYTLSPDFIASFLFNGQIECCESFPAACTHFAWYPNLDGSTGCTWGEGYTMEMLEMYDEYLFNTEDECCVAWCDGAPGATATSATEPATTGELTFYLIDVRFLLIICISF